ncbi:DUF58 domain-containing protein [Halobacterium litoreum]|uniref:DUF58 domain-containing protein n=1 Tax=Halobacterium litoreum TaxID=2039234 RepID=A0ABD5NGG9_9EURY|nr:DUF58 domain-containing protein [Halobacterium litoreum]UHH12816.1 DUF58 domain-containing protein [Halobacterium litoreum]
MEFRDTHRWRGAAGLSLLAVGAGAVSETPGALLLGAFGVAFVAYARVFTPPTPDLSLERTVHADDPQPGDEVDVTLTVTNDGGFLPDLRLVDGVPSSLDVVDGSPRLATALRAGKRASMTYTVEAARGDHEFSPVDVVARDVTGAHEVQASLLVDADLQSVPALPQLDSFPLRSQTVQRVGRVPTSTGGSGVEFHATREYRTGDPLSRVDWKRLARTGDLSTVQFREERAASVVAVVDTRDRSHVADDAGEDAVEYSVEAAGGVASALLDSGDQVGVAAFGPHWAWLQPGLGREHRARVREMLATDRGFARDPPDRRFLGGIVFRRLRKHLPGDAQVVFCSPLVDDNAVEYVRRLEASGHPVTVVSPDVTGDGTFGQQVAMLERAARIRSLRKGGVRVVDWTTDEPLALAVATAERGWSA